jgi:hypothetical protein
LSGLPIRSKSYFKTSFKAIGKENEGKEDFITAKELQAFSSLLEQ